MEKEFAPYKQALDLVLLGYTEYSELYKDDKEELFDMRTPNDAPCILWQQAFRWFREKYDLNSLVVFDKYICEIDDKELENPYFTYYYSINELWSEGKDYGKFTRGFINVANNRDMLSYEEAELSCLKKLIEIVKQK